MKTQNFTKDAWAHTRFCQPDILQFLKANNSLNITRKELKFSVIIYFHTLLSLCIQHDAFYQQSRMFMRKNVNSYASKDPPIVRLASAACDCIISAPQSCVVLSTEKNTKPISAVCHMYNRVCCPDNLFR